MAGSQIGSEQRGTILVVDDEEQITRSVEGVLRDGGYATIPVNDGARALEAVRSHSPDVVVLDIWLPGMDGIQLLRDIKAFDPEVEVIMISGHANIHTAVSAVKLGAFEFIEKPLSIEALLLAVGRALEHRHLVQENRELRSRIASVAGAQGEKNALGAADGVAAPDEPARHDPERLPASHLRRRPPAWLRRLSGKRPQRTLKRSMVLCGQGLHSGLKTGLILSPLPPGSGIVFGSISTGETVPARIEYVLSTGFATTISNGAVTAKTVEHFLAVLHAYRVSNLLVKMDDEIPIMDGSAREFCQLIEDAGVEEQDEDEDEIVIQKRYSVGNKSGKGEVISIEPDDQFVVEYTLDYPKPVGRQQYRFELRDERSFREQIAPARTFGFVKDVKALAEMGLASGGRLDNLILIDEDKLVGTELRFPEELARHKILDVLGDFYLLGRPIRGKVTARLTGHSDNIALLKKIQPDFPFGTRTV